MVFRSLKVKAFTLIVTIMLVLIKMFTSIIRLSDDPVNFLVIRLYPSFSNETLLNSHDFGEYVILFSDENGLIGDSIYFFITGYLWWLMLIFSIVFVSVKKMDR